MKYPIKMLISVVAVGLMCAFAAPAMALEEGAEKPVYYEAECYQEFKIPDACKGEVVIEFTKDLVCRKLAKGEAAITIANYGLKECPVTVLGNGYTMDGNGDDGVAFRLIENGVRVQDLTIRAFKAAIAVEGGKEKLPHKITGNVFEGNGQAIVIKEGTAVVDNNVFDSTNDLAKKGELAEFIVLALGRLKPYVVKIETLLEAEAGYIPNIMGNKFWGGNYYADNDELASSEWPDSISKKVFLKGADIADDFPLLGIKPSKLDERIAVLDEAVRKAFGELDKHEVVVVNMIEKSKIASEAITLEWMEEFPNYAHIVGKAGKVWGQMEGADHMLEMMLPGKFGKLIRDVQARVARIKVEAQRNMMPQ